LLWKAWKDILLWCLQSPAELFYYVMNIPDGGYTGTTMGLGHVNQRYRSSWV